MMRIRTSRRRADRRGLTIVELLVAMVSASVLALTAGVILVFCFRTLRANGDVVGLQRDVDIATRTLYRAIRSTRGYQVSLPAPGATGARLTIDNRSFYRAGPDLSPNAGGAYLVYDADTGSAGGEQVLVNGTLSSFTFTHLTNAIGLSFVVAALDDRIQVDTAIHMRNEI